MVLMFLGGTLDYADTEMQGVKNDNVGKYLGHYIAVKKSVGARVSGHYCVVGFLQSRDASIRLIGAGFEA